MSTITELTLGQRKALFTLVEYQNARQEEVVFWAPHLGKYRIQVDNEEELIQVSAPVVELWEKCHYVSCTTNTKDNAAYRYRHGIPIPTLHLVLRQEAFNYASFMAKPAPIRALIRFWNWMTADMPAFLWGIMGALIIQLISSLLGF